MTTRGTRNRWLMWATIVLFAFSLLLLGFLVLYMRAHQPWMDPVMSRFVAIVTTVGGWMLGLVFSAAILLVAYWLIRKLTGADYRPRSGW